MERRGERLVAAAAVGRRAREVEQAAQRRRLAAEAEGRDGSRPLLAKKRARREQEKRDRIDTVTDVRVPPPRNVLGGVYGAGWAETGTGTNILLTTTTSFPPTVGSASVALPTAAPVNHYNPITGRFS